MEQKSNKTDHVLNLLSGTKKKNKNKIATSTIHENEAKPVEEVSTLIQKELEKELESSLGKLDDAVHNQEMEKVQIENTQEKERLGFHETESSIEEQKEAEIEQDTEVEKGQPTQMEVDKKEEYEFINVMEYIVSIQAKEYMKKFDTCLCSRCRADIIAYALTHLPAKYIVINLEERIPLLRFYEKKYDSQVRVELIKACMIVKENPHHN